MDEETAIALGILLAALVAMSQSIVVATSGGARAIIVAISASARQ
jgi:hypothetical protein